MAYPTENSAVSAVSPAQPRVRFAPSPTGFLHVGSARTFIFNWLYARHHSGAMILRLDDTDLERNTEASVTSIFDGLRWLGLDWNEEYKQSERLELHRKIAWAIFEKGLAYRDFTPAHTGDSEKSGAQGTWLFNPGMRELSRQESDCRAGAGEPFALRFRVPRESGEQIRFTDAVYGEQAKAAADTEDFALLRSDGMPTYHLASCADDIDLRISHIIRGQDHLSNTFKHVLIFEAAGAEPPQFAHLPLLVAPDGTKLSKRRHGPVVSVTTYRDAGFLPEAFINFLCLLGWSPKNDREMMSREELVEAFSLEGINRANAVVNFKETVSSADVGASVPLVRQEGHDLSRAGNTLSDVVIPSGLQPARNPLHSEETFDPKAVWLNAEHIRALPIEDLSERLLPIVHEAGFTVEPAKMLQITPLIRERIKLLRDVLTAADFFFVDQLPPYDPTELIPQKGDAVMASKVLQKAKEVLARTEFKHDALDQALRAAAQELGLKAGQMFQPIRVAVCGRKNAPPLFETLEVLGRETTLPRIEQAIHTFKGVTGIEGPERRPGRSPSAGVPGPTTYVFGAGASLHVGYPLASAMGEALLDFMLRYPMQPYPNAAQFLIDTFGKSPNIEDVITALGSRINDAEARGDKTERMKLGTRRGFLRDALAKWFQEIHTKPAGTYAEFAEKIAKPGDVVITFNYDDSLERELKRTGKWDISRGYGFPLGTVDHSSDVLVLKLHGSINWLVSIFGGAKPGSGWIVSSDPLSLGHYPVIHPDDLDYLGYKDFSGHTYTSGGAFACLILPGRTKEFFYDTSGGREYAEFWDSLWSQAAEAVKRSDKIVLCGYSLLPADQRACALLLQEPRKETHVSVVSGGQSERIADDFRAAGFRNVGAFRGGYFEDWVQSEAQKHIGTLHQTREP